MPKKVAPPRRIGEPPKGLTGDAVATKNDLALLASVIMRDTLRTIRVAVPMQVAIRSDVTRLQLFSECEKTGEHVEWALARILRLYFKGKGMVDSSLLKDEEDRRLRRRRMRQKMMKRRSHGKSE